MGVQMLVSDYLDQVIKSRPYKYSTKQSLIRDVKRLGIADLDTSEITSALIRDKVATCFIYQVYHLFFLKTMGPLKVFCKTYL